MSRNSDVLITEPLAARFAGELLGPSDPGYDDARHVHNGLIDKRPALIARCHTTADVRDALQLARDRGAARSPSEAAATTWPARRSPTAA